VFSMPARVGMGEYRGECKKGRGGFYTQILTSRVSASKSESFRGLSRWCVNSV
jgi:hypothetical protein